MSTYISTLIIKKLQGVITSDERIELNNFAAQSEENRRYVEKYSDLQQAVEETKLSNEWLREDDWRKIKKGLPEKVTHINPYLAAAVVFIALGVAWLVIEYTSDNKSSIAQADYSPSPFHKAVLTLGNGQVLKLYELKNGPLGDDGMLTKKDGELIYPLNYQSKQPGMNILETLKSNFYRLRLPDGSTALLNSASSIQYPNSFTGENRTVTVQGEVYFEVAKNPAKPFIVKNASSVEIEVKGTKFYVDAYKGNNTVKTTLVEGAVEIKRDGHTELLKPGEQAIATVGKKIQKINVPNAERRVQGWKENKFTWVGTYLTTIFEDLSHWYGFNLIYKTNLPSRPYSFNFDRSLKLEDIFEVLQTGTGLTIKLDNNTIIISR